MGTEEMMSQIPVYNPPDQANSQSTSCVPSEVSGTIESVKSKDEGPKDPWDDYVPQAQHGEGHCFAALLKCSGKE